MRFDPAKGTRRSKIDGDDRHSRRDRGNAGRHSSTPSRSGKGEPKRRFTLSIPRPRRSRTLGAAAVGTQTYITSIDADPTGRFLYYVPGAHGGSERDGSPVVQFDVKTRTQEGDRVPASLLRGEVPAARSRARSAPQSIRKGDKLYITWNNSRGSKVWDSCVLTVVHVPASERKLVDAHRSSAGNRMRHNHIRSSLFCAR